MVPPLPPRYSPELRSLVAGILQQNPAKRPTIDDILQTPAVRGMGQARLFDRVQLCDSWVPPRKMCAWALRAAGDVPAALLCCGEWMSAARRHTWPHLSMTCVHMHPLPSASGTAAPSLAARGAAPAMHLSCPLQPTAAGPPAAAHQGAHLLMCAFLWRCLRVPLLQCWQQARAMPRWYNRQPIWSALAKMWQLS